MVSARINCGVTYLKCTLFWGAVKGKSLEVGCPDPLLAQSVDKKVLSMWDYYTSTDNNSSKIWHVLICAVYMKKQSLKVMDSKKLGVGLCSVIGWSSEL